MRALTVTDLTEAAFAPFGMIAVPLVDGAHGAGNLADTNSADDRVYRLAGPAEFAT